MRTLLLTPALFASEGGIERMMRVYLLALHELSAPGDQLDIAAYNDQSISPELLRPYAPGFTGRLHCGGRRRLRFAWWLLRHAYQWDRVICGHFHFLPLLHLARRLNPQLKVHIVAHGTEIWRSWTEREQKAARHGIIFFPVSDYTRERILARCPEIAPTNLRIVPNTFDPTLTHQEQTLAERVPGRILTVTRLSAADSYKGVDHLIQALPLIRKQHPQAHLRIVGAGDDRKRLETLAAQSASDAITFAGFVPDEQLASEYQQASLFALPSRDEGFGLVYLEAFQQGTPALGALAGAAPELITPEVGVVVPYGEVAALGQGLANALSRPWSEALIRQRAANFDFEQFKRKLAKALAA
jgi:glycosyltransferase involved in cell wall biosynthesis